MSQGIALYRAREVNLNSLISCSFQTALPLRIYTQPTRFMAIVQVDLH